MASIAFFSSIRRCTRSASLVRRRDCEHSGAAVHSECQHTTLFVRYLTFQERSLDSRVAVFFARVALQGARTRTSLMPFGMPYASEGTPASQTACEQVGVKRVGVMR